MTPTHERPTLTFRAFIIYLKLEGSTSSKSIWPRLAPRVRISLIFSGSVRMKPLYMSSMVTIRDMARDMVIIEAAPAPIQTMETGPRAG